MVLQGYVLFRQTSPSGYTDGCDQFESHSDSNYDLPGSIELILLLLFKLNVSYLESKNFRTLVQRVWNLSSTLVSTHGWIPWEVVCRTVKFIRDWGRMIVSKKRKELSMTQLRLDKICIFLEE
jgi:hypothetical protein